MYGHVDIKHVNKLCGKFSEVCNTEESAAPDNQFTLKSCICAVCCLTERN